MSNETTETISLLSRAACIAGIWALKRLYGECAEPHQEGCHACDATKLIHEMRWLLRQRSI